MSEEECDKYKKVVAELDGYDICDEFNLGTYELKDKKKLLEIVLMYYFKNQDELQQKENIIKEVREKIKRVEILGLRNGKTIISKLLNDILEILDKDKMQQINKNDRK